MTYYVSSQDLPVVVDTFDPSPAPDELPPGHTAYPSLCLTFEDERARNSFLRHLQGVLSRKVNNPTLSLALSKLVRDPEATDTWIEDD